MIMLQLLQHPADMAGDCSLGGGEGGPSVQQPLLLLHLQVLHADKLLLSPNYQLRQ